MILPLIKQVFDTSQSARSLQTDVGPSEIGGCRRRVWHRLQGTASLNPTRSLAAFMGTAIHEKIEKRLAQLNDDRYLPEVEVYYKGMRGHVDLYDRVDRAVIDWKTITLKKVRFFPSEQQWTQVQIYGLLLTENGYPVDRVTLVGIPRDGDESDIVVVARPWDRKAAEAGFVWLEDVRSRVVPPEPERSVSFCRLYCQFWDPSGLKGCPGRD